MRRLGVPGIMTGLSALALGLVVASGRCSFRISHGTFYGFRSCLSVIGLAGAIAARSGLWTGAPGAF